jgi:hypothetical protein
VTRTDERWVSLLVRAANSPELLAAIALGCLYFLLMSGHLHSVDGLIMYRDARALVYDHSLRFNPPLLWGGPITSSKYGIGLPLLYVPGLIFWSWLRPYSPAGFTDFYNWGQFYADPLYTVAAAPVHAIVTAATAYLIARFCRALGASNAVALWGVLLYGIGSPALVYARGDFSQPLTGLCWTIALYAAWRYRQSANTSPLVVCAIAVGYAVLTRPVEGSLVLPAVLFLLYNATPPWRAWLTVLAGYGVAVLITVFINAAKYGSPLKTGYGNESWTTPLPLGLAGALISPGRGLLWSFPALILVPFGIRQFWHSPARPAALALIGLSVVQLLNVAVWDIWRGGWTWGLRLFVPALPLLAIVAACGIPALAPRLRFLLPALLLTLGLIWAIPAVITDLLGGYAGTYDGTRGSFRLSAYPPFGAWTFFKHWRAVSPTDQNALDILWLRAARGSHNISLLLIPCLGLLLTACVARVYLLLRQRPS